MYFSAGLDEFVITIDKAKGNLNTYPKIITSAYFCPKKLIGLSMTFIWTNIEFIIPEKGSNKITHANATAITGDT